MLYPRFVADTFWRTFMNCAKQNPPATRIIVSLLMPAPRPVLAPGDGGDRPAHGRDRPRGAGGSRRAHGIPRELSGAP
jgi:hypothetical protein